MFIWSAIQPKDLFTWLLEVAPAVIGALATGGSAEAFLGTQGYVWDTQSDMALALLGALVCLVFLSRPHDRQLDFIRSEASAGG